MSRIDTGNIPKSQEESSRLSRADTPAASKPAPNAESQSPPKGDAVSLSQSAAEINSLEAQLRTLPGVDQSRVDAIRESIAEGRYAVDADKVVRGLLSLEKSLS